MVCASCGKKLDDDAGQHFCKFCGAELGGDPVSNTSPYLEMPVVDDEPTIQGAWWNVRNTEEHAEQALTVGGGLQEVRPAHKRKPLEYVRRHTDPRGWEAFADSGNATSEEIEVHGVAHVQTPEVPLARSEDILLFWFGDGIDPYDVPDEVKRRWFTKDPEFDRQVEMLFGGDVERAAKGEYTHWNVSARGRLAHLVLLDQFSCNIYRNLPQAFANDANALAIALDGMHRGHDVALRPVERVFYYLPFEHTEDLEMQNRCVDLMRTLADEAPRDAEFVKSCVVWATKHRDIIARFGHFPHRNEVLGRVSTPQELEFLKQPGSSF